jgi:membrane associated rhomboid family serine protease
MELSVTIVIIVITTGVSLYAMRQPGIQYSLTMNPYMITKRGQFYRLVTSGFIHGDHMHLIFNMFSFYFFGSQLEYIFQYIFGGTMGSIYFILMYVLAIIVSDVPTLFKHQNNQAYNSLGASGAVAAVIFACILFQPLQDIYLYGIPIPGVILGAVYIIYSYYSSKQSRDNINHDAHLYGALFGLAFCIVLYPDSIGLFIEKMKEWSLFK